MTLWKGAPCWWFLLLLNTIVSIMAIYIWLHSTPVGLIGIPKLPDATWPTAQRTGLGLSITLYALSSDIPWCPLWKRNRELSVAENRVAQILGGGGRTKSPAKPWRKWVTLFYSPPPPVPQCLHALALISLLVGSQEAPLSPVLLRELQLYKMGEKCSLYELFFTLVWVQNGSCTPTVCDSTKASNTEKQVSK